MNTIFIISSGVGLIKRGFETYAKELYSNLINEGLNVYLIKGGGKSSKREKRIFCIPRYSMLNKFICKLINAPQKKYYIEFLSFSFFLTPYLLIKKPKIIYALESPIYKYLLFIKKKFNLQYKLIHFSGGQIVNQIPDKDTILHHVTPCFIEKAINIGFNPKKQILIPHFLTLPYKPNFLTNDELEIFKKKMAIPANRKILLSVGNIDSSVKRMDYIITEIEELKGEYYLIILGQYSEETEYIYNLAKKKLGANNFMIKTVSRKEISHYYQASDIFVLASLMEGFGLVYIEALENGLPVIAHDFDISRYVLKDLGIYLDLSKEGVLKNFLINYKPDLTYEAKRKRFEFVYNNYSWDVLKSDYLKMFEINE